MHDRIRANSREKNDVVLQLLRKRLDNSGSPFRLRAWDALDCSENYMCHDPDGGIRSTHERRVGYILKLLVAPMSARFPTTSWSLVAASGEHLNGQARRALETLCERYWYPLYAFIRRQGYDVEKAQDLTQEFFTRIIEKNYVLQADPLRGRFRTFLLVSLKNFLCNEADRERAHKRGGGHTVLPIEPGSAEESYKLEPGHDVTPEKIFERSWALTLLKTVMSRLQQEFLLVAGFYNRVNLSGSRSWHSVR